MRRRVRLALAIAVIAIATTVATTATADGGGGSGNGASALQVRLSGYQEDPNALSTTGTGQFRIKLNERAQTITYRLSYAGLEGAVTQSHIHFGGKAQSGGISIFLCTNIGNGPAGTQACPAAPATITGTIRPVDVIGPAGQGISAGQFDEVVKALRARKTYVNLHSTLYPGGEIRAQLVDHH